MRFLSKMTVVGALALAGCNQSNEELNLAQQRLQAVTAERDSLKTQLEQAKADLAAAPEGDGGASCGSDRCGYPRGT